MRYSKLFTKTKKNIKSYDTKNAELLEKAGFINQLMAGVYSYLPLGLIVLNKISQIVRLGMNEIGGQEVLMPILHPSENWKISNGWNNIDVLFKLKSRTDKDYALAQSAEEVITPLIKEYVHSYRDIPFMPYQIQWKYRDELRAKSGIMRGREFLMKDMYSIFKNQLEFDKFYEQIKQKYLEIYKKLGLIAKVTEASGGAFSEKISYEFMVLTDAGEDDIFYCQTCDYCINKEIAKVKENDSCPKCKTGALTLARASEVGNVFDLGNKYQKAFDFSFLDQRGEKQLGVMGCYGIGISRLMGVIVEKYNDEKGIIWPENIAPFKYHLIALDLKDPQIKAQAEKIYSMFLAKKTEVLFDDREEVSAGNKFADADLIGIPNRLVISKRTNGKVELKKRIEINSIFTEPSSLM